MTDHTSAIAPRVDLDALSAHFLRLFPSLDEKDQKVALALYRSLSQGHPVSAAALARAVRLPEDDVVKRLSGWPGVYYDKSRHVIGFWGLTIMPMPHRLLSDGIALYAWCAWDTLFLPELIGGTLDVESTCRGTGQAVRLTATPTGVHQADSAEVVLSFLIPDSDRMNADVIASFCHYVHFFRSPQAALPWLAEHRDSFLLSLADAYALGRRINSARYDESLLRRTEVSTNGFFPPSARLHVEHRFVFAMHLIQLQIAQPTNGLFPHDFPTFRERERGQILCKYLKRLVGRGGFEPPTNRLKVGGP